MLGIWNVVYVKNNVNICGIFCFKYFYFEFKYVYIIVWNIICYNFIFLFILGLFGGFVCVECSCY